MKALALLVLFSASWSVLCQVDSSLADSPSNDADDIVEKIDTFVKSVLGCFLPPALSLAVVKDGQVVVSKGYGHTTADRSQRTTSKTKFAIGSLTKAFTSLLIAKTLNDSDSITLDTPISEYIDNFRLVDDYRSKYATLRDLLSHRVAVLDYVVPFIVGFDPKVTRNEFVRRMQFMETPYSFRQKYIYSNNMYILAGDILERVNSGRPWEDLVQDNIFTPLGMVDSGFANRVSDFSSFALPCDVQNGTLFDLSPELLYTAHVAGSAGIIYSTADDMAKWMNFLLSDETSSSGIGLSMKSKIFEPGMSYQNDDVDLSKPLSPISYKAHDYCMGFIQALYREYKQFYHTGGIVTYSSRLWLYPELKIGIFLSVNGPEDHKNGLLRSITYYISDLLIGLPSWFDIKDVCDKGNETSDGPGDNTPTNCTECSNLDLASYVGNYSQTVVGVVSIYLNDTTNQLHFSYGRFGWLKLQPVSKTNFKATLIGPLSFYNSHEDINMGIEFSFDKSNRVSSLLFAGFKSMGHFKKENVDSEDTSNGQIGIWGSNTVSFSFVVSFVLSVHLTNQI